MKQTESGVASSDTDRAGAVDAAVDGFFEELSSLLPEGVSLPLSDGEAMQQTVSVGGLFSTIGALLAAEGDSLASFAAVLLGMTLLLALLGALSDGADSIPLAALVSVLTVSLLETLIDTVGTVTESLHSATAFFSSLIPLFTAVTAAAGGESTAAVSSLGMTLTVDILSVLLTELLLPLGGLLFALGLVGMLGEGGGARALGTQLGRLFSWGLGLLSTLVAAAVSLQTVLASATDSMALRTARYTLAGMLPTVGGTVAGSLSTVIGGLSYVKSTVGVGVIFVLLCMLLPPLLRLLAYRCLLGCAGALLRYTAPGLSHSAPDALRGALDIYIALLSIAGVLMILEVVLFIRCGASLA